MNNNTTQIDTMQTNMEPTDTQSYMNVIDVLQTQVNKIAQDKWEDDVYCPPKFIVSEFKDEPKILITIDHAGYYHTTTLFPNGDYGNKSIADIMEQLYNSTM